MLVAGCVRPATSFSIHEDFFILLILYNPTAAAALASAQTSGKAAATDVAGKLC